MIKLAPNHYPHKYEEEAFSHPELMQFNDGDVGFGFRSPGDRTPLGFEGPHTYAQDFFGDHMAIIMTETGDNYGVANGLVMSGPNRGAWLRRDETLDIMIGQACELPGVGVTSPVVSVLLYFQTRTPHELHNEFQVDQPSPFTELRRQAEAIRDAIPRS